jgi:D-glycero-D-manno-heptose 1,7-bisphosphate phosphatase
VDKNYLSRVEDIEYYPDTMKALQLLQQMHYELFIVTNQSGVGRGYFSLESVYVIHRQIQNDLRSNKLEVFKDFAICPHAPDDKCECRKPSGKMIQDLLKKHHLQADKCYMIGDKLIDAQCGQNAGIQGVMVRSKGEKDFPSFKNLLEFAHHLKSKE